jgi:hypothetical protein
MPVITGTFLCSEFLYCPIHGGFVWHVILWTTIGVTAVCMYDGGGEAHPWNEPVPDDYVAPIRQTLGLAGP